MRVHPHVKCTRISTHVKCTRNRVNQNIALGLKRIYRIFVFKIHKQIEIRNIEIPW